MMNKEVAQKWVEALRSGQYTQTREVLRGDSGYCCLGVLCEVYRAENPAAKWDEVEGDLQFVIGDIGDPFDEYGDRIHPPNLSADGEPPRVVQDWAGIGRIVKECIDLNDTDRASFTEIAAYVEKEAGLV